MQIDNAFPIMKRYVGNWETVGIIEKYKFINKVLVCTDLQILYITVQYSTDITAASGPDVGQLRGVKQLKSVRKCQTIYYHTLSSAPCSPCAASNC